MITKEQAIKDSIKHWERMIAWAKKQPKLYMAHPDDMKKAIGENWGKDYCTLCTRYYKACCYFCPLAKKHGSCIDNGNHFVKVSFSYRWGDWVKNAKIMLKQLRSLL